MKKAKTGKLIEQSPTGIPGIDWVSNGGLPKGRTTLVAGTAGSAKTLFAVQFLVEGARQRNESGVLVSFEETPDSLRANMAGFGWDIAALERRKKWAFVDVSPTHEDATETVGDFDFGGLMARIRHAVERTGATRVSVDSLGSVFSRFESASIVRRELLRMAAELREMGVTSVITVERLSDYGDVSRFGVEDFVADNVIILRNVLEGEKRRRTLEILKVRGSQHQTGEFPFTILSERGLVLIPIVGSQLQQRSSTVRISSGSPELDEMCGGGFFRDSIILVSGPTGTGKTLLATEFAAGMKKKKERTLFFGFEESREQLFRNAKGWGHDFPKLEREGRLKLACRYPEVASVENHYLYMKALIDEYRPTRVAVDSLSALERTSSRKGFREFVLCLTAYIKEKEIAGLFTCTTPNLLGETSITEAHISTITDSIILLRYVEMLGTMRRGVTVLKMRGSMHDKTIREFSIDGGGIHILRPVHHVSGILSGNLRQVSEDESDLIGSQFGRVSL